MAQRSVEAKNRSASYWVSACEAKLKGRTDCVKLLTGNACLHELALYVPKLVFLQVSHLAVGGVREWLDGLHGHVHIGAVHRVVTP